MLLKRFLGKEMKIMILIKLIKAISLEIKMKAWK
jgi:hypothetical protein